MEKRKPWFFCLLGAAAGFLNGLFGAGGGQQRAGFGLQLQPQAGAAVAPVVPFQAHDAAAGAQVGGAPGPLWLRKPGQQQRV